MVLRCAFKSFAYSSPAILLIAMSMSFEGFGLFGKRSLSLTHPPAILRVVWEDFGRTDVRRWKRLLSALVRVRVGFIGEAVIGVVEDDEEVNSLEATPL